MPSPLKALCLATLLSLSGSAAFGQAPGRLADLLPRGTDLSNPAQRARIAGQMRGFEEERRRDALARAAALGLPVRIVKPNGAVQELVAFEEGQLRYFTTHNSNAATSSGANLLQAAPLSLTASGVTVGVWDGGAALATHREFTGRASVLDGGVADNHATHVSGTIAASGIDARARGMASEARIDSYEWTSDKSEMTSRGATYPGEPGKIALSNHSYGFIGGWSYTGKASPIYEWWGNGTTATAIEQDFGKYDTNARDTDSLAASAPYYLILRSAGNDRYDNPAAGQPVALTGGSTTAVSYDPALHPPGDAHYRGGYDTIGFDAIAKNVLTVGSASDAVSGGVRSAASAFVSGFSCWGPTDDGRIKPDVVANGEDVFSSLAGGPESYGSYSGTSMATPNATGSAALLVSYFAQLFPAQALRASTLKGLLIHTADDRGAAGPDYQNGWGLIDVSAAADLLASYHTNPGSSRIVESRLTTVVPSVTHSFVWDGVSPIRATLCWTDPAGARVTSSDDRNSTLVNNLDLKLVGPGGVNFSPYIMPFVGNWTPAAFALPATTGKNNTDNVEQVFLSAPGSAGTYSAVVSVDGTLSGGVQNYSLLISGSANAPAAAPALSAVSPTSGSTGMAVLTLSGSRLSLGATVKLTKAGQPDIFATGIEVFGDTVKCRVNLADRVAGVWNVVVANPDGQLATLSSAFTIVGAIWQDDLEGGAPGWTHGNSQGTTDNWALSPSKSRSATRSFFAAGPAATNINDLNSPALAIPASATNLSLSFWHNFAFHNGRDGGVLEFSVDGGTWTDVTASGSGAAFATGGYSSTLANNGPTSSRNPLAPRRAWTGSNAGFTQVVVNFTDNAKFAGHTLRLRWRLATNNSTASAGWYLDDFVLTGGGAAPNLAPSITSEATATPAAVLAASTLLGVSASDDASEASLVYTWSYAGGSFQTPVSFSENGTNAAKATTATFTGAGSYTFLVTARDAEGLTATSSVDVVVEQTPANVTIAPTATNVGKGATQLFTASVLDQFSTALSVQPAVTWSVGGGGTIAADGTFSAMTVGGPFAVTATSGTLSGNASVTVTGQRLSDWRAVHFSPTELTSGSTTDLADFDGDGVVNLLEYALGTDPRNASTSPAAALDAAGRLTLTFTRPKGLPDVTYSGEAGGDLVDWLTSIAIDQLDENDPQTIRITDPIDAGPGAPRFLRLRVKAP